MTATTPPGGVELQPGSAPVTLPLTVRNDGGSPSEPVVAALNLPPGVHAVDAGGGGAPMAFAQAAGPIAVNCPGGDGTVVCRTGSGLQPGQSAVLTFRLKADETAAAGSTVTGSVTAGTLIRVAVSVQVTVKPPPDAVVLEALGDGLSTFPWTRNPLVYVRVRNTGQTTKPVTVTFDHPLWQWWSLRGFPCQPTPAGATCTTRGAVAPGQHVNLWVRLKGRPAAGVPVTINATLGTASAPPAKVYFDCWREWCGQPVPPTTSVTPPTKPTKPTKPPTTTSPPPVKTTEPETTTPPVDSTTTSAPPPPSGGNPGQKPPTVAPEGFFNWLTG